MSWWDSIKKTVKNVATTVGKAYISADKAVGGYLPGGKTPTQVKTAKATTPAKKTYTIPKVPSFKEQAATQEKKESSSSKSSSSSRSSSSSSQKTPQKTETPQSGWQNVIDTISVAAMPFSGEQDHISVYTDSRVFNTAAEYVANAPYAAALMLSGVGSLVKSGVSAITGTLTKTVGKAGLETGAGFSGNAASWAKYSKNMATAKLSTSLLAKVVAQAKKPMFVLTALVGALGTYPWGEWAGLDNAKGVANMSAAAAMKTGDPELIKEAMAKRDEIFDMTMWENIQRMIPGVNLAFNFGKATEAAFLQKKVTDHVLKNEIIRLETGETQPQTWIRNKQEEEFQKSEATNHYNEERQQMILWEQDAYAAARATKRTEEIKARNEDAAFWASQAAKQRELEAQDRQAIADFWENYRETQQKLSDDNRPSNLNFGLL